MESKASCKLHYPIQQSYRLSRNGLIHIQCPSGKIKPKEFPVTKPLFCEKLKALTEEKEDQNYEHLKGNTFTAINNGIQKPTKQTSRTETQSALWRSFGGLWDRRRKGKQEGGNAGISQYKLVGTEQTGQRQERYGKWSITRTYNHAPGLQLSAEWLKGMGLTWTRGAEGKNLGHRWEQNQ